MADRNYDEDERALINELAEEFDIGLEFIKNCEVMLKEYITFQTELNQLILE